MKPGLTKRERIMLFIAVVFVLLVGGFQFGIKPASKKILEQREEYDQLLAEKLLLDMKLDNESNTRAGYDRAKESFETVTEYFPFVFSNEEIDRVLTGICLENKMYPTMLGISNAKAPAKKSAGDEESGKPEPEVFTVVTATMNLNGEYDALKNLISAVDQMEYIRIIRVSYSDSKDGAMTGGPNISVLFEITMLNEIAL